MKLRQDFETTSDCRLTTFKVRAQIIAKQRNTISGIKHLCRYDNSGRFKVDVLFPNNAESAFGSLGYQTVYHLFNQEENFTADLVWLEVEKKRLELKGEIIALSIAFELDIFNLAKILIEEQIEPLAEKREGPLVICGGVLPMINPLPLTPFADIIMLGDGELLIPVFAELYEKHYLQGKEELLKYAAGAPGFLVPRYNSLAEVQPLMERRKTVLHSWVLNLQGHFGNAFLVEAGRGCPRKCRFCASAHLHTYEYHSKERIIETIREWAPPKSVVGLIGSSLSDHPDLEEMIKEIVGLGYKVTVSSLRPDVITLRLAEALKRGGMKTLTIAPEAGSLRMRKILGKGMSDRTILSAVEAAYQAKIERIKLYFMIGIPGEEEEDITAIVKMANEFSRYYPAGKMELSINTMIPKPGTPFELQEMAGDNYIKAVRRKLREEIKGLSFTKRSYSLEYAQAALSQGDEKAGLAVLETVKTGISFKDALQRQGRGIGH